MTARARTFDELQSTRTDWTRLILDLRKHGYTMRSLAVVTGISAATICRLIAYASPRHEDGEVLLAVWCEVMGKDRDAAPKEFAPKVKHGRDARSPSNGART